MFVRRPPPIVFLLACYLGLALGYHLAVPLWESPDAIWHYAFVVHLARGGGLPNRADQGLQAPWRQQGSQPPLYYLLAAPLARMVGPADEADVIRFNPHAAVGAASSAGNINRMVHTHREAFPWRGTALAAHLIGLLGIALGAIAVVATYRAAQVALPELPAAALASAALLALNPQFVFLSGAIGNDIAVTAASALCLWQLMVLVRHGPSPRHCLLLGLTFGLAALAKLSGLWLLPPIAVAVVWSTWRTTNLSMASKMRSAATRLGWFGIPAAAVAGWWFVRNWLVFGDPSGLPVMLSVMQPRAVPPTASELGRQMVGVWKSYWAVFGWFNLPAPDGCYAVTSALSAAGLAGVGWLMASSWRSLRLQPIVTRLPTDAHRAAGSGRPASPTPRTAGARLDSAALAGLALASAVVLSLLVALLAWARLRYPQGRLLFPASPAFSLLVGSGLVAALPKRWATWLATALTGSMAALTLGLLLLVVRPAYQPRLLVEEMAAAGPGATGRSLHLGAGPPTPPSSPHAARSPATPPSSPHTAPSTLTPPSSGHPGASLPAGLRAWQRHSTAAGSFPSQPRAVFGGRLALLTTDVEGPRPRNARGELVVHPGETVTVRLLWAPRQPMAADYSIFLHLVDANRLVLAQRDSYPQSGLAPTSEWWPALGEARLAYPDEHRVRLPPTIGVAGGGKLILGVYDHATGERLKTAAGADHLELGALTVATVVSVDGIPNPLPTRFGDSIRLLGFELDRRAVKAGRKLHLTLHWQSERRLARDYKVSLQLRRGQDETWGQTDEEPDDSRRPTSGWAPGERIRDYHSLEVYPEAPPGRYELFLKLYDPHNGRALPVDDGASEMSFGAFLVSQGDTGP